MSNHNEAELAVQQLNRSKKNGKIVNCCRATTKTEREAKSKIRNHFKSITNNHYKNNNHSNSNISHTYRKNHY